MILLYAPYYAKWFIPNGDYISMVILWNNIARLIDYELFIYVGY